MRMRMHICSRVCYIYAYVYAYMLEDLLYICIRICIYARGSATIPRVDRVHQPWAQCDPLAHPNDPRALTTPGPDATLIWQVPIGVIQQTQAAEGSAAATAAAGLVDGIGGEATLLSPPDSMVLKPTDSLVLLATNKQDTRPSHQARILPTYLRAYLLT